MPAHPLVVRIPVAAGSSIVVNVDEVAGTVRCYRAWRTNGHREHTRHVPCDRLGGYRPVVRDALAAIVADTVDALAGRLPARLD